MGRLSENSVVSIKNKSHAVTAEVAVPAGGAEGVIIAQGGSIGGWSLYLKEGRPRYCYNLLGVQRFYVGADTEVPEGTHQVRMEFDYAGPGMGKGGTATLYLDGVKVGEGEIGATAAMGDVIARRRSVGPSAHLGDHSGPPRSGDGPEKLGASREEDL